MIPATQKVTECVMLFSSKGAGVAARACAVAAMVCFAAGAVWGANNETHGSHPLEDSASLAHVASNGDPKEWIGGAQWGEHLPWVEGPGDISDKMLKQTDSLLRSAYEQVFRKK